MDSLITRRSAIAAAKQEGWVRPSDWLPLPSIAPTEQKFVGLHAIFEDGGNFATIYALTAYTVDWGDGIVENFASGVTAYHEYNYATYDVGNTTLCSQGYKQAIVTVTPQSGASIYRFRLSNNHNAVGLNSRYSTGWLDIKLNFDLLQDSHLTIGTIDNNWSIYHGMLECIEIKKVGDNKSFAQLLANCINLKSATFTDSLQVSNWSSTFENCYELVDVNIQSLDSAFILSNMFKNNYRLIKTKLFNLPNAANLESMYRGCINLKEAQEIYAPTCVNFNLIYADCEQLIHGGVLKSDVAHSMTNPYTGCHNLRSIPLQSGAKYTTAHFSQIPSLLSCKITGVVCDFSITNCKLSANELNAIYSSLGTVSGKTISISLNYGAAASDRSIATAKGWTVTG